MDYRSVDESLPLGRVGGKAEACAVTPDLRTMTRCVVQPGPVHPEATHRVSPRGVAQSSSSSSRPSSSPRLPVVPVLDASPLVLVSERSPVVDDAFVVDASLPSAAPVVEGAPACVSLDVAAVVVVWPVVASSVSGRPVSSVPVALPAWPEASTTTSLHPAGVATEQQSNTTWIRTTFE